jgi:hypothetical protein
MVSEITQIASPVASDHGEHHLHKTPLSNGAGYAPVPSVETKLLSKEQELASFPKNSVFQQDDTSVIHTWPTQPQYLQKPFTSRLIKAFINILLVGFPCLFLST